MGHSPAPWTFEYVGSSSAGDDGIDVYEVCNERMRIAEHMHLDDARLIAAAPELLEALHQLIVVIGLTAIKYKSDLDILQAAVDEARAVIAKATGSAS